MGFAAMKQNVLTAVRPETLQRLSAMTHVQAEDLMARTRTLLRHKMNSPSGETFEAVRQRVEDKPQRSLVLDDAGREVIAQIFKFGGGLVCVPVPEIRLTLSDLERIVRRMQEESL